MHHCILISKDQVKCYFLSKVFCDSPQLQEISGVSEPEFCLCECNNFILPCTMKRREVGVHFNNSFRLQTCLGQDLSSCSGTVWPWASYLNSLSLSVLMLKEKIKVVWSSNSNFGYIIRRIKSRAMKWYLYTHVPSSITYIYNSQKVAINQMSINGWMDKQNVVLSIQCLEKEVLTHATTQMKLEDLMLSETSQSQKDKHCVIIEVSILVRLRDKRRMVVTRSSEDGEVGRLFNGYGKVLEVGCTIWIYLILLNWTFKNG